MTPQTEHKPNKLQIPTDEYREPKRLVAAFFLQSAPFGDERMSCAVGQNCDSITPACLGADGMPAAPTATQTASGVVVRRKQHNLNTHDKVISQCFVPFSNVRGLLYGE